MELGGKGYLLLPLALVETGDDYDLARFRRMEQERCRRMTHYSESLRFSHCSMSRISSGQTECGMS